MARLARRIRCLPRQSFKRDLIPELALGCSLQKEGTAAGSRARSLAGGFQVHFLPSQKYVWIANVEAHTKTFQDKT